MYNIVLVCYLVSVGHMIKDALLVPVYGRAVYRV